MITKLLKDLDRIEEISGPLLVRKRFNHKKSFFRHNSELAGIMPSSAFGTAGISSEKTKKPQKVMIE